MDSGRAAQFTATKAPRRPLRAWMVRAKSSFPVPDSPLMTTDAVVRATRRASCSAARIAGLSPTIVGIGIWAAGFNAAPTRS